MAKTRCACGNPKCRVAELEAKMPIYRAALDAAPVDLWGNKKGPANWLHYRMEATLREQRRECNQLQKIAAVGPSCPYCARPVQQYGAPVSPETCGIVGRVEWRDFVMDGECLDLAWDRLKGVDNG